MDVSRYWAFISYSHADEAVATWLHKALETYRVPRSLVGARHSDGEIPRRLFPVFRDRDELASSGSLGSKLTEALQRSETLIVIASRKSAASRWVNEEIRSFKALGKSHRVFCLIVDGEPFATHAGQPEDECFAPALRFKVRDDGQLTDDAVEPIAADIRPGKDRKRDALLKLVAGVLEVGLDALKQRDQQRQQRRLIFIAAASLALAAFAATLSLVAIKSRNEAQAQRAVAQAQQKIAEVRRTQAEGLIQFMLGDLREKLEPIGKLDILDAVGDQAMKYFGQVDPAQLSDQELSAQAQALRQIGKVRAQQGKLADASPAFQKALRLDTEIVDRHPLDQQAIFNVAQSIFYIGYDLYQRGQYASALPWMEQYLDRADQLVAADEGNPEWQLERAYAEDAIGELLRSQHRAQDALPHLQVVESTYARLLKKKPDNNVYLQAAVVNFSKQSETWFSLGQSGNALDYARKAVTSARRLVAANPQDANARHVLGAQSGVLYSAAMATGNLDEAGAAADESLSVAETLVTHDPNNVEWKILLVYRLTAKASLELLRMQLPVARSLVMRALNVSETLKLLDPEAEASKRAIGRAQLSAARLYALKGRPEQLSALHAPVQPVDSQERPVSDVIGEAYTELLGAAATRAADYDERAFGFLKAVSKGGTAKWPAGNGDAKRLIEITQRPMMNSDLLLDLKAASAISPAVRGEAEIQRFIQTEEKRWLN